MKAKNIICLMMILVLCGMNVPNIHSQTTGEQATIASAESKQNLVSLDILRFFGFYNLSYTRAITPAISLTAQLEIPTNFLLASIIQETGFGGRLEARYNFAQKNLVGIYIAPTTVRRMMK